MDKNNGWRNRDWIWLVGILVVLIILLIAGCYNNDAIELNFSIISSAVSIALALVAIFIALKQDSDNQRVTSTITNALIKIESKVDSMDGKIDNLDPNVITKPTQEKLISEIQEIFHSQPEDEGKSNQKIAEIVNEKFNEINNNLQLYYDNDKPKNSRQCEAIIEVSSDKKENERFINEFINIIGIEACTYKISDDILTLRFETTKKIGPKMVFGIIDKYDKEFKLISYTEKLK
ncbi:hypothetical protein [Bacillus mycoides]|uniref:hypothetical protein n=1 Tax=Bacillus mycoides TaxID=1405 RepID=UPI002E1AD284|nr:hypothetical protein [Bacillus mycoides]HDR7645387.1 hypothetical protein [Bacillus mycoides]